jgi:diphosphomevalonate decarboxylase
MRATARAQPNIALIKYWGKRNRSRNLPAVGSISITLADLYTDMCVELDKGIAADTLTLNGKQNGDMLPRVSACLDTVLGMERLHARIDSRCNFPVAAGLASSASAFASAVVATSAAAKQDRSIAELSRLAGRASGSAARSLYGGFAELRNRNNDIEVESLLSVSDWPLQVVVALTTSAQKTLASGDAMEISRKSSPFYERWVQDQEHDLDLARAAILARDFDKLASVAEHNCLKMHSVMWTSRPPIVYWNAATLACMQVVRELRAQGAAVFFTVDAGPQVKAVCLDSAVDAVRDALKQTPGVCETLLTGLGEGARLMECR